MDSKTHRLILETPVLICDFDGTLAKLEVDWEALKIELHSSALKAGIPWAFENGFDIDLRRIRREISETAFQTFCHQIAEAEIKGFKEQFVNIELVELLVQRGKRSLAVFSSNTAEAISTILKHRIFETIQPFIVGKENVVEGKPNPEGIESICSYFRVSSDEVIFLGDSDIDRKTGEAAGVNTVLIEEKIK